MSTVLRPVGPRPPGVYWLRRLILLVVLAVIVLLLAKACSGGSSKKSSAKKTPAPKTTASAPTTTGSTTTPPIAACDPSTLTLTLSTDAATYSPSQAPRITGVISNPTSTACTLTKSAAKQFWTVTSGPATIWTTKGCPASKSTKTLTINAGATKMLHIVWNGYQYENCTQGAVAAAGTYHVAATLDGVTGAPITFHIADSTTTQ